jgi:AcrR family transcriptional regulator
MIDLLVSMTEEYLGEIIEDVLDTYYADYSDEIDYDRLLEYIASKIIEGYSRARNYEEYDKLMRYLSQRKSLAATLVSYLVSRFIEESYPEQ